MEFGAEQVKKRLKSSEIQPDAESLPAFYQTTENGLTVAKHPTLGQLKGIRTGNLSIASGSPMPLVLTEGLPRFPTPTQEASPKPKTDKKRYYWTYFYKLQMTYKSMTVVVMDFTDWPKRAKFLQDGEIIEQQSLSKSVEGISVQAVQKGTFFEVTVNVELLPSMSYFASQNSSSPAEIIKVEGTIELWASTSTIYLARGVSKLVLNLEATFTIFGGNPANSQVTGNLQPNQRWSISTPSLFFHLSDNDPYFLTSGARLNIVLCSFPAILENKPNVVLIGPINYSNPNACRSN